MEIKNEGGQVVGLHGLTAQEVIDSMVEMKTYVTDIVVIARSANGHIILKSSYMDIEDNTMLVEFAKARNMINFMRLQGHKV